MTPSNVTADLHELTASIVSPETKPELRMTLVSALGDLGHDQQQIKTALDNFFRPKAVH